MSAGSTRAVRVGVLGAGVVGSQVVRLLIEQADELTARVGATLELAAVAVRRPERHADIPAALLTTDAAAVVADPEIDVVVEVIGGIEPTKDLLLTALNRGAGVVTANKALLAEHGPQLYQAADAAGADLYYEAAVAGAIPLIRPLRESLAGDRIQRIMGIVNGTTNFILSAMVESGMGYQEALAEATRLGYAEADPTADVEGFDAAAKAAILASLAFHTRVSARDVYREGITAVSAADVAAARESNCVVKLLAICERVAEGGEEGVSVRVHPAMISRAHPLAGVRGAFNAVFVESTAAGSLMFYGAGAGGRPTASAVLGDVVAVARHRVAGGRGPGESRYAQLPVRPMGQVRTRYHVRLDVADRPGVLASVARVFADHDVSIETVRQTLMTGENASGQACQRAALVVVTHSATDAALSATVAALAELDIVDAVVSVLRVEGV
jgi:homoserine dehydrogenase